MRPPLSPDSRCETSPAQRRRTFLDEAAATAVNWFDPAGRWLLKSVPLRRRERFWISLALYHAGFRELADTVVQTSPPDGDEYSLPTQYNIFSTNIALVLLLDHRETMAREVRSLLEGLVEEGFGKFPGNRAPDYQFHGYNDNMPAKATMALILGGEMLGNREALEHGLWNLRQFGRQLARRGINSEYQSPTYTPLTLHAIAEIGSRAADPEARQLARDIEARLWIDVAARFHPQLKTSTGPFSRAYTVDAISHLTVLSSLLWFELGDLSEPSPMELFDTLSPLVLHHMGNRPFNIAQMSWIAAGNYHCPELARSLFENKEYPFRVEASTESGNGQGSYPAAVAQARSYLEEAFAIGTSTLPFLDGNQPHPYHCVYAQEHQAGAPIRVGTIYSEWARNGELPGRIAAEAEGCENRGEVDLVPDVGSSWTLSHGRTAILLSCPSSQLAAPDPEGQRPRISRLDELIVFASHFERAQEIRVNGVLRRQWAGPVEPGAWIACRRGRLLVAFRPLVYSRERGTPEITLEENGPYQLIRTRFFDGETRPLSDDELLRYHGGFIAEHACVDDFPSLEAFCATLEQAIIRDFFFTTRRLGYQRSAGDGSPYFELSWSPRAVMARHSLVNGMPPETPALEITGLDCAGLPLLGKPPVVDAGYFPWEHLRCAQAPWPWAIAASNTPSRGSQPGTPEGR